MEGRFYEKDMPKIDLPEDWLAGTDINPDLLSLYTDFPVRLKCEILNSMSRRRGGGIGQFEPFLRTSG